MQIWPVVHVAGRATGTDILTRITYDLYRSDLRLVWNKNSNHHQPGGLPPDLSRPISTSKTSPPCSTPRLDPLRVPSCCHRWGVPSTKESGQWWSHPTPQIQTACTTLPNLIRISQKATILDSIEFVAFSGKSRIHLQEICWPFVQWRWPAGGRLCVTHRTLRGTRPRFSSSRLLDSGTSGSRIPEKMPNDCGTSYTNITINKKTNDKISIVGWLCHKLHHCSWCGHDPRWCLEIMNGH